MAHHDYNIANQRGRDFRTDLNNLLQAIATNNLGGSLPTVTFPGMIAIDTTDQTIYLRSNDNTRWFPLGTTTSYFGALRITGVGGGLTINDGLIEISDDFSGIPTPSGADLLLSSTGITPDSYEWKTIIDAIPYSSILGILNHVELNQANPNGRRLIDYFRSTYDLVLPLPPRGAGNLEVFLGQGQDTFWQEFFPLPKPSASGLVLTSSAPNQVRWDEAPSQGTQTANEMIVNPTADSRIYNAATLASAIATRADLDGSYLLILGNLNDLDLTANRLLDAIKLRIAIVDSSNGRTIIHEEQWTRVQDRRLIPFDISTAEESGAANRFQRENGRTLYKFTVTFLDASDNPITELTHHAPLWIEDGVLPISAGLENGAFTYRLIGSNLTNNSIFTVLDNENTLYIEATITGGLGKSTKIIKTLDNGTFQDYVIEEQNQNVAGFRLSRTGNNITVTNLSRIDSLKVENVSCRGVKGDKGDPGPVSTTPGPKGDPGPASTVPGPQGPPGKDGNTGDPQGLRIASTTFTIDQDATITAEDWVLTPDSSGNLIEGTRLSLRTHRPTSGTRDHTARIGYMFKITRSTGGGNVVDSSAIYLYGDSDKLELGLNAQIVSTLAHGSVDLSLSYGRTGSFVDITLANGTVSNEWSVTTFEQSYSLDVYELNVQGIPGEKGEKGDPGSQPPLGDRARSVGATSDNGDATTAARADHKHDLKITSDFEFSSDDILGLSDSFKTELSKFGYADPSFTPEYWLKTNTQRSFILRVDSSILTSTVTQIRVTFPASSPVIKILAIRSKDVHVYPVALTNREVSMVSVPTTANQTLNVTIEYLQSDDTVETTQTIKMDIYDNPPEQDVHPEVFLTQAEYDALTTKDTNTYYNIY